MDTKLLARYLEFRPAWPAFAVYIFGAALFLLGPMINPQAPIRPALSQLLGTCFVAFILLKRFTSLYRIEGGRIVAETSFPTRQIREAVIEEITRIDLRRGITQRLMGVAHVHLYTGQGSDPAVKLFGVPRPDEFRRLLLEMGASDQRVTGAWR